MSYYVIVFRGHEDYKELPAETFSVTAEEWEKYTTMQWKKNTVPLQGFKNIVDVRKILGSCEVAIKTSQPTDFLTTQRTMNVIREIAKNQKSQFDETYY